MAGVGSASGPSARAGKRTATARSRRAGAAEFKRWNAGCLDIGSASGARASVGGLGRRCAASEVVMKSFSNILDLMDANPAAAGAVDAAPDTSRCPPASVPIAHVYEPRGRALVGGQ